MLLHSMVAWIEKIKEDMENINYLYDDENPLFKVKRESPPTDRIVLKSGCLVEASVVVNGTGNCADTAGHVIKQISEKRY
jgi:hypothetical protein